MVNFMDRNTNGVQQYYQTIRERLANYIKSDYLANSETLLLYADDILGEMCPEEINIAKEPYIETSSSYRKVNDGIRDAEIPDNVKEVLLKLVEAKLGIYSTPFEHQAHRLYADFAFACGFLACKRNFAFSLAFSRKTACRHRST